MYTVYQGQVLSALRTSNVEILLQLSSQSTQQAFIPLLEGMLVSWQKESSAIGREVDSIESLLTALSARIRVEKSNKFKMLFRSSWINSDLIRCYYMHECVYKYNQSIAERLSLKMKEFLRNLKSNDAPGNILNFVCFLEENKKQINYWGIYVGMIFAELIDSKEMMSDDRATIILKLERYQIQPSAVRVRELIENLKRSLSRDTSVQEFSFDEEAATKTLAATESFEMRDLRGANQRERAGSLPRVAVTQLHSEPRSSVIEVKHYQFPHLRTLSGESYEHFLFERLQDIQSKNPVYPADVLLEFKNEWVRKGQARDCAAGIKQAILSILEHYYPKPIVKYCSYAFE